jgi:hypothetical protein
MPIISNFESSKTTSKVFNGNDSFKDTNLQICEKLYKWLINIIEKVLEILKGNILEIYWLLLLCFINNVFNRLAG